MQCYIVIVETELINSFLYNIIFNEQVILHAIAKCQIYIL